MTLAWKTAGWHVWLCREGMWVPSLTWAMIELLGLADSLCPKISPETSSWHLWLAQDSAKGPPCLCCHSLHWTQPLRSWPGSLLLSRVNKAGQVGLWELYISGILYFRCGTLTSKSRWFYNWVSRVYHFSLFYSTCLWDREVFRCEPPVCGKDRPQTKETGCHSPGNTVRPFQTLRRALCLVWMEPFVHDEGRPWGEYSDLHLWKVWKNSREHVSVGSDKVYINSFLGWNREICGLCASAA